MGRRKRIPKVFDHREGASGIHFLLMIIVLLILIMFYQVALCGDSHAMELMPSKRSEMDSLFICIAIFVTIITTSILTQAIKSITTAKKKSKASRQAKSRRRTKKKVKKSNQMIFRWDFTGGGVSAKRVGVHAFNRRRNELGQFI